LVNLEKLKITANNLDAKFDFSKFKNLKEIWVKTVLTVDKALSNFQASLKNNKIEKLQIDKKITK